MLEFIKFLVECASRLANAAGQVKQRQLQGIGQGLFLIHFRTTEVIDTGDDILSVLKRIRECVHYRTSHYGEDVTHAASVFTRSELGFKLYNEQYLNLYRLHSALSRIQQDFKLLDAELETRLRRLVGMKQSALQYLTDNMRAGKVLLNYPEDVDAIARVFDYRSRGDDSQHVLEEATKHTIDVTEVSGPAFALVVDYLDSGKPDQNIAAFRTANAQIRDLIEKYWTIQDLLPGMDKLINATR